MNFDLKMTVAVIGMAMGFVILMLGRRKDSPKELRIAGGFLLIAGFCILLELPVPRLW